jgi:hypothetical protein
MQVKHISGTRGHIVIELTDGRYVYVLGELTMDAKFYADIGRDWFWAKESVKRSILPDQDEFLGVVSDEEKEELMRAVRSDQKEGSMRIIFD